MNDIEILDTREI